MENVYFQKKLDTIEDHHNKHTIEDQGCSWTTPLKKCLDAFFLLGGFNKAFYMLGNLAFLRIPNETQKVKNNSKGKNKRNVCFFSTAGSSWTQ